MTTIPFWKNDPLETYVRSLRNPNKRAYARTYKVWRQNSNTPETEPCRQDYAPLSYMAAQAVRMRIDEILRRENEQS